MTSALEQPAKRPRPRPWRTAASIGLLAIACLLAMVAVLAVWVHLLVLDTNRFVAATSSLVKDPAVQQAIADRVTQELFDQIAPEARVRQALPDSAAFLAGALSDSLERYVNALVLRLVQSQQFQQTWENLARSAHSSFSAALQGQQVGKVSTQNGTIAMDLRPVTAQVIQALDSHGVGLFDGLQQRDGQSELVLFQSPELAKAQDAFALLNRLVIALPIAALVLAAGSVLLAGSIGTGLLRAGIGVAIAMLALLMLIGLGRNLYLDALPSGIPAQAAADFFDVLLLPLQSIAAVLLAAGAGMAAVAYAVPVARRVFERTSE